MAFLLDLTHTSHTSAQTGIQKVARFTYNAMRKEHDTYPLCYDRYAGNWRKADPVETQNLRLEKACFLKNNANRGSHWSLKQKCRGRFCFSWSPLYKINFGSIPLRGLLVSEMFDSRGFKGYHALFPKISAPKIAVFHDSIALKLPEFTPKRSVAYMPFYLKSLLMFDGIAAISEASKCDLLDYWKWLGVSEHPRVEVVPLACDFKKRQSMAKHFEKEADPVVLCVSAIEGRKNHVTLLKAAEKLWEEGFKFRLEIIGVANQESGHRAVAEIQRLEDLGRPIRWRPNVSEEILNQAYEEASFTVYPSLMEGFGLPVLESLSFNKPCICSGNGAIGEIAKGGGCLLCDVDSVDSLKAAVKNLLTNLDFRAYLTKETEEGTFRSWDDYVLDLTAFFRDLESSICEKTYTGA